MVSNGVVKNNQKQVQLLAYATSIAVEINCKIFIDIFY